MICRTRSSGRTMVTRPICAELLLKISANDGATMTLNP